MNYLPQPAPVRDREHSNCVPEDEPAETWIDARQELFALRCELSYMAIVPAWRLLARGISYAYCCLFVNPKVRVR